MTDVLDVIDALAGIRPGTSLDAIRRSRPETRTNAQASFEALFGDAAEGVPAFERWAIAAFVTALYRDTVTAEFYAGHLSSEHAALVTDAAAAGLANGPYGAYPTGPLSAEDTEGPTFRSTGFDDRLGVAIDHAHLLVLHPRDADAAALETLLAAGWTTTEIVTISQIIAFLSFQVRVISGLRLQEGSAAA